MKLIQWLTADLDVKSCIVKGHRNYSDEPLAFTMLTQCGASVVLPLGFTDEAEPCKDCLTASQKDE